MQQTKTLDWVCQVFDLSASGRNSCPQPKSPLINRLINDRLSDNQTLPQLINILHRMVIGDIPTLVALPRFCINYTEVGYVKKPQVGAMMNSGVSRRSSLTAVRTRCAVETSAGLSSL